MKTSFQYFTEDSSVTLLEENVWKGNLSPRWSIGSTPNGGYSMALATRAISGSLTHKDPLSITANYLERVDFGEAIIKVEPLSITNVIYQIQLIQYQLAPIFNGGVLPY